MRKNIRKWMLTAVILLVLGGGIGILTLKPHLLFLAGESIGIHCRSVKMTQTALENPCIVTLDALREDERVSFDQSLMLINTNYLLPDDFTADVTSYKDTEVLMNTCIQQGYQSLANAVYEKFGEKLYVSSSYRSAEEQEVLYIENQETATKTGSSEHQAGLALDVYVPYYAGNGFIQSKAGRFVNTECWKYGFIIRYPVYGEDRTGIPYEPWHIRYVGEPHAKLIYNNHITLEEYLDALSMGIWYEADGYLISRQEVQEQGIEMPDSFSLAVISPDNTGCYLITVLK